MFESGEFLDLESILLSTGALLGVVVSLVACAFCFGKKFGFKEFKEDSGAGREASVQNNDYAFTDTHTQRQTSRESISFDPLPDPSLLLGDNVATLRPRIAPLNKERLGTEALQESFNYEFSRTQIQFIKELGTGWFGKVLQGEAEKISIGLKKSNVVVKMLDVAASDKDKVDFLLDCAPYRELEHANVVRLLGQCTKEMPFLVIMEYFPMGDLKSYLTRRQNEEQNFSERRTLVRMACDMAAGLHCLHFHHFVHNDFAIRNCMVAMDLSVKVGDYGIAEDLYEDDYYTVDDNYPVPIRWSAPETTHVTNKQVIVRNMTKEANVWSLGIALWELMSLGCQPYPDLSDDEVIEKVLEKQTVKPAIPDTQIQDKGRMHKVMLLCLSETPRLRPTVEDVHRLLQNLQNSPNQLDDFDRKWNSVLPSVDCATGSLKQEITVPVEFHGDLSATAERNRLSFTQGFEIDNKAGLSEIDQGDPKMIVNPSFENEPDYEIEQEHTPTLLQEFLSAMEMPSKSVENALGTNDNANPSQGTSEAIVIPMTDGENDTGRRSDSFRNSIHMLVTRSPSEGHIDIDVSSIEKSIEKSQGSYELEKSGHSFVTVDSSITSPSIDRTASVSSEDFVTPVGSLDFETIDEMKLPEQEVLAQRRRVSSESSEHFEDTIVGPPRARVISDPPARENLGESASAAERMSQFLSGITPPPYSPSKSPGLQEDPFDYTSEEQGTPSSDAKEEVTLRRKVGTTAQPSLAQRDSDPSLQEFDLEHQNRDTDSLIVLVGTDHEASLEEDGTPKKRSAIRQPQDVSVPKKVSFTERKDDLVQVHTYPPEDGGGPDEITDHGTGNREAAIYIETETSEQGESKDEDTSQLIP